MVNQFSCSIFVVQTTITMTTRIKNQDIIPLLTGRTPQNINRLLSYFLKKSNIPLTREQWSIMAVLWKNDGCPQQILADATDRDRPGITRLVDNLEKENMVERKPDPNDRRTNLIFLTKKGREIENSVIQALNDTIEIATKGMQDEDLHVMRKAFDQINQNIQEFNQKIK